MKIDNQTNIQIDKLLHESISGHNVEGLKVEIKHSPKTSRRYISGTYYRLHPKHPNGKLIRIRINTKNKYPLEISFKTSDYFQKKNRIGELTTYQKLIKVKFDKPEELIIGIFLHEFSHYLDHQQNLNGKFKQTKADKFAIQGLVMLGIIKA